MKRSIGKIMAVILGVSLLVVPISLMAKTKWNFSVWGGKRAFTRGLDIAKIMWEKADPDFELNIALGDALSPRKQNLDNIKIGVIEGAVTCAGYHPNKVPLMTVMELPFILPTDINKRIKIEQRIFEHPAVAAEMKKRWNGKVLFSALLPTYEFMGNKRIARVADMKGVRMRISGTNAKALQIFGAVPTMVTAPEGYQALERGTIDSFGFPWTYAFGAYKLYEVSKYATEGIAMGGFSCAHVVSLDSWNAMPKKSRDMLPEIRQTALQSMIDAYAVADKKWYPIFKEKLEVVPFPTTERAKLVANAEKIWNEWAKEKDDKGMPGTELLNFVKDLVKKSM